MKNKRIFIFYILLFLVQNIFAHNERDMDISILLENNSDCTELYKGWIPKLYDESVLLIKELYNALISIDKKITNSKPISINKVEQTYITDGVYKVEYLLTGKKYEIQNNSWIYESESKKFYRCDILNELQIIYDCYNYSDFYNKYYLQDALNIDDCKNINFVKWLFTHETDIQIKDKYIEIIENQYSNGIPITVKQLPYYYKIKILNEEYNQYKTAYRKSEKWKIYKNNISFCVVTKFELACIITKHELIFGFGNMDIIHP
ncbi:hypothetical protein E4N83_11335 [Treponema denticola]|uniref:hypothetical protein n=1 Tax=Treponema denticola TaxID=158 RepID=UPI0020A37C90|nr:hypothetical protein [Treponema denticola]UTC96350.1 hypothetical protein E4N85_11640 [Treponema denticola]UTC98814.1 hypothetical protein E4N83_11335 [Treponema denticola]